MDSGRIGQGLRLPERGIFPAVTRKDP